MYPHTTVALPSDTACGAEVHYDAYPSVRYRQHGKNIIGSHTGWSALMRCLQMFWERRFRYWEDLNVAALMRLRPLMLAENQHIFDLFCEARRQPLLKRTALFAQIGVYRQTFLGNLGLAAAVVLKKI